MKRMTWTTLAFFGASAAFGQSAPPAAPAGPDIEAKLARWKTVEMPFRAEKLSKREREMVERLVDACRDLENIYWRQSDPEGLALYRKLSASQDPGEKAIARYIWINGGRYDLLDENRLFMGTGPTPPGRALYPADLTRKEIEAYVAAHPEQKAAIYSERTVVVRDGARLKTVPYHVEYRPFLERAAKSLRAAADLSDEPAFAKFLRLRAKALLTDEYYESDLAWVDLVNPKFDLIFAPYETYLDGLLGVKGSYGAAVLIRNEEESRKLSVFQKYVPEIQDSLPLPAEDRPSKRGKRAPMEVMDAPFRAGDLRHGYQAVADNLPNDPRIHEQRGTKQIFFKNFMDARVNEVIVPVARVLLREDQALKVTGEGYLQGTLMHEISHGIGPAFARQGGAKKSIRETIGPGFSALEEAKADVGGLFGLDWLIRHGALPKEKREEYYASHVGGIFRTVRFGTGEPHARAEMMEFNYLSEQGAVGRDARTGRYVIDFEKMPGALASLAKELLEIEATGDRARCEAWFQKYGTMPPELATALEGTRNIPIDVDPKVPFPEGAE
ncbi:MAG: Zn-dependent hydrolase [Acidobacteriota bacterium]